MTARYINNTTDMTDKEARSFAADKIAGSADLIERGVGHDTWIIDIYRNGYHINYTKQHGGVTITVSGYITEATV